MLITSNLAFKSFSGTMMSCSNPIVGMRPSLAAIWPLSSGDKST